MLEFNADTPTSLYEAGIVQWFWLQEFNPLKDQFNSIHEKLLDYWQSIAPKLNPGVLHFSCIKDSLEDLTNVEYLRDCAIQAGLETEFVFMEDIGWDHLRKIFEDLNELPIKNLFKLYPWEWIIHEPFGPKLWSDRNQVFWIEPPWKMILSNKAILPLLWQMNPGHPLLLPAYFDDHGMTRYVRKPLLSREGANVEIIVETGLLQASGGDYGEEGYVFQQYSPLPDYGGNRPILGTWIIGGQAAGMGIRECDRLITDNSSRFVPHLIDA
jgi:glutathionylspermidine synthase